MILLYIVFEVQPLQPSYGECGFTNLIYCCLLKSELVCWLIFVDLYVYAIKVNSLFKDIVKCVLSAFGELYCCIVSQCYVVQFLASLTPVLVLNSY